MRKILFLYHVKEREYEIIRMIAQQIKQINSDVEIKIEEFYQGIWGGVLFMPDVIVTIPLRDAQASNYLTVLKVITRAKVISMVTEGYYTFSPQAIKTAVGYNSYAKELIDCHIMWGTKTKEMFGRIMLEEGKIASLDKIKVTGYAWYETDYVNRCYREDERYKRMHKHLKKYERNILVVTGFQMADWSIREYQLLGCFGDNKPLKERSKEEIVHAQESIAAEREFRSKYIDMIDSLAKLHPDVGILVKLHPVEVGDGVECYDKLHMHSNVTLIKENIPLACMLNGVDCMIHYNSTSHFEAYIYRVATIQMYDDSTVTELDFAWQTKSESTYLINIDDFTMLNTLIEKKVQFKRSACMDQKIYELFNWKWGKDYCPIEKIADYIIGTEKAQHLRYLDSKILTAIQSKEGQEIVDKFVWHILKNMGNDQKICKEMRVLLRICKYIVCGNISFQINKLM